VGDRREERKRQNRKVKGKRKHDRAITKEDGKDDRREKEETMKRGETNMRKE
jgi:hypothetical protein